MVKSAAAEAFQQTLVELGIDETDPELGDPRALGRRAALLGVRTRQAVNDRVKRHRLLALPTADRELAYPTFQFGDTGQPYPAIAPVLEAFTSAGLSPHTIASWFVTPQATLDEATPARWLAEGGDTERLVAAARRSAARAAR
jgi:hypothetical protein